MGFWTKPAKQTHTARPAIATNNKLTATEFEELVALLNENYQEHVDLVGVVSGIGGGVTETEFSTDIPITASGIYVFQGGANRTVTINDSISGDIVIISSDSADLTLSGNINPLHLGVIYAGQPRTTLRWNASSGHYNY